MKKLAIAAIVLSLAGTASALELGVNGSYDYAGTDRAGAGVTLGQKFGKLGITAGFDRSTKGVDQNRYSLVASYDVAKIGQGTVAVKGGAAYLDNTAGVQDGYAALVGVGYSYPFTKTLAGTIDVRRQYGQDRVQQFDGNQVAVGVKVSF